MLFPEPTTHAILLDKTRKQVLLIRCEDPLGQIVWGFPGGHIERGEKVKDALKREVKEETGYQIEVNQLLGVYDNIVRDFSCKKIVAHIINIIWMAKVVSGALKLGKDEEIIDAKWFPIAKAEKLVQQRMTPTARKILHDALSLIGDGVTSPISFQTGI